MRTILAISLIAAAFATAMPAATAECVNTTCAYADGYSYGTCDNGTAGNYVQAYNYDASGYTYVSASTFCYGYPGYYSVNGVGVGAATCDSTWNCDSAGAYWQGGNIFGSSYCSSQAYTYVNGQYQSTSTPLCTVGAPPAMPALLP